LIGPTHGSGVCGAGVGSGAAGWVIDVPGGGG